MCPENATNVEDGSDACAVAVLPGTNLTTRYAVIVSFGVFLNGTSLADIAPKVQWVPYPCLCTAEKHLLVSKVRGNGVLKLREWDGSRSPHLLQVKRKSSL